MPIHIAVTHSRFFRPDRLMTFVTILWKTIKLKKKKKTKKFSNFKNNSNFKKLIYLAVFLLITVETMRLAVNRRVLMSSQWRIANPTTKMIHVPTGIFSAGIFRSENQLVTRFASRDFHFFGVVTTAKNVAIDKEINQIGQHFLCDTTTSSTWDKTETSSSQQHLRDRWSRRNIADANIYRCRPVQRKWLQFQLRWADYICGNTTILSVDVLQDLATTFPVVVVVVVG